VKTPERFILAVTTVATREDGERLAAELVTRRLAACVNIMGNCRSMYVWNEALETADEYVLLIKTRESLFDALQNAVLASHPYAVPELIAIPIVKGFSGYLQWLQATTEEP
jgi:periplasmic divalent cation tolerance protein